MADRHDDDENAETQVLPGKSGADEAELAETVVLGDEYRRRVERGDPERDRDD